MRWPAELKVAVNLSAIQVRKTNLFDVIMCALAGEPTSDQKSQAKQPPQIERKKIRAMELRCFSGVPELEHGELHRVNLERE